MPRQRKTKDVWVIVGRYPGCPKEDIDSFDTYKEARKMLQEYRLAFGPEWSLGLKSKRERIEEPVG